MKMVRIAQKKNSAYTQDLINMILCVVTHCISSPGSVHKITKSLQALNEKRSVHKKRKIPDASEIEYLCASQETEPRGIYFYQVD